MYRLKEDNPMIFGQLFEPQSSTYSHLLSGECAAEAVLIDPVFEQARRDGASASSLPRK